MDDLKKTVNGQLYWHYSLLKNWEKNDLSRSITEENWLKLVADIKKNGVEEACKIDGNGTIYDGNHRKKAIVFLIEHEHVEKSDNGKELKYLPVATDEYPDEAKKWRVALSKNAQYAQWNEEGLMNFSPEFEESLDISLINVSFSEPKSIDQIVNGPEAKDLGSDAGPHEKKPIEVDCPQCHHHFTIER